MQYYSWLAPKFPLHVNIWACTSWMFFTLKWNESVWNRKETHAHTLSWPEVVTSHRIVGDPSLAPALPYMEQDPRLQVHILILIMYHSTEHLNSGCNGEFISSLSSLKWTAASLKRLLHIAMIQCIRRMLTQNWSCECPTAKTALFCFYFEMKY